MTSSVSDSTRKMAEAMDAVQALPPLTLAHLDALIDWIKTGKANEGRS